MIAYKFNIGKTLINNFQTIDLPETVTYSAGKISNLFKFVIFFRYTKKELVIRLGEYDFGSNNETQYIDYKASDIRLHPDYDLATHKNDIALVKLNRPVIYNSFIRPICLPKTNMEVYTKSAVVAGKNIVAKFSMLAINFVFIIILLNLTPHEFNKNLRLFSFCKKY